MSEIGLGSWLTFGAGVGRGDAEACVDAAFEAGITLIDTANVYAYGAAEEFLGESPSALQLLGVVGVLAGLLLASSGRRSAAAPASGRIGTEPAQSAS